MKQEYEFEAVTETLLSDLLKSSNYFFSFPCNGQGSCGKCRIKVNGLLEPPTMAESKHLTSSEIIAGYRLACQTKVKGKIMIELPDHSAGEPIQSGGPPHWFQRNPLFQQIVIPGPTLPTWESIAAELPAGLKPSPDLLRQIPGLPKGAVQFWVEIFANHVIGIHPAATSPKFAVAVDLGTTTLAAYLIDFSNGAILKTASIYNPQGSYGTDLVSRIQFAGQPDGLKVLHDLILGTIQELVLQLTNAAGIDNQDIWQMNLAGNTCMTQLLLGVDPRSLGVIPFTPTFTDLIELAPEKLGLPMNRDGLIYILPGIGGFIGSDISAGILACNLSGDRAEMLIDIGTNGEMVLTGKGRMLACSTAAGPAFEGARISCGMMAVSGAITDLQFDNGREPALVTINNSEPQGICGTGFIRIVVELIKREVIIDSGRFNLNLADPNFDAIQKRYYLLKRPQKSIFVSERDIREFQLAKGAIRAGIELLIRELGIVPTELSTLYLAGAFGTYLKPEDAIFLGLLPQIPLDRIRPVGNTAGMGTIISILSPVALADLTQLVRKVEHIELANIPDFTAVFAQSMLFPAREHE